MSTNKKIKAQITHLTSNPLSGNISELKSIMEILRDEECGCPWDREQDHLSLRPFLIEEAYEAVEAIESNDTKQIINELGDVLLQVVFHSQLAQENGDFTLEDVIQNVSQKMIRRHPHVFSDKKVEDSKEVLKNWEQIKQDEKDGEVNDKKSSPKNFSSDLKKLPVTLPALIKAEKIGEKSARVQFDWLNIKDVLKKVEEEFLEIKEEFDSNFSGKDITAPLSNNAISNNEYPSLQHLGTEIGDCIFSLSQLARWIGQSSESLTRECCNRFITRLEVIEEEFNLKLEELSAEDKTIVWQKAKAHLELKK